MQNAYVLNHALLQDMIEFEADVKNGQIQLPKDYSHIESQHIRVVAFFNKNKTKDIQRVNRIKKIFDDALLLKIHNDIDIDQLCNEYSN